MFDLWEGYRNTAKAIGISDEDAYWTYNLASGLPFVGDLLRASDSANAMADYMRNRGLDWGSIKYPTRTVGNGISSATGAVLQISKNIASLY